MFSKFEIFGAGVCVCLMALAIYLVQVRTTFDTASAQPAAALSSGIEVVPTDGSQIDVAEISQLEQVETNNNNMVIDDIKIGTGADATDGDNVAVHYVGRLQDGTEFDNSHKRGAPIEFKIGAGQVIPGWEEGITGMKVGGERVLVIPPEKAYGERGIGPIPPNSTLEFTVELVAIN